MYEINEPEKPVDQPVPTPKLRKPFRKTIWSPLILGGALGVITSLVVNFFWDLAGLEGGSIFVSLPLAVIGGGFLGISLSKRNRRLDNLERATGGTAARMEAP